MIKEMKPCAKKRSKRKKKKRYKNKVYQYLNNYVGTKCIAFTNTTLHYTYNI